MKHSHEQNPHSFKDVEKENSDSEQIIEALTPEAIIRLKSCNQMIDSAVKEGQINERSAKLAKFLATAAGRTATVH